MKVGLPSDVASKSRMRKVQAPRKELSLMITVSSLLQTNQPAVTRAMGDYDAISQISKGHNSMNALLSARNKNLQIVRAMWSSGNVKVI